jgi:DNA repair exonuclease SbcCD ATPase subunit
MPVADIQSALKADPDGKYHLDDLLSHDGDEFIRGAYWVLLRRAPDESGLAHYRDRLRDGAAKVDILDALRSSTEGQARDVTVHGLEAAVQRRKASRVPLLGRLAEILAGMLGVTELQRNQRELEERVRLAAEQLRGVSEQLRQLTERADQLADRAELAKLEAAHAANLENLRQALAGAIEAIEKRAERRELTALTNNLVAMTNARLTRPDIAPIEQAIEELQEVVRSKADLAALQAAQAEAKAGLEAALATVAQVAVQLGKGANDKR